MIPDATTAEGATRLFIYINTIYSHLISKLLSSSNSQMIGIQDGLHLTRKKKTLKLKRNGPMLALGHKRNRLCSRA